MEICDNSSDEEDCQLPFWNDWVPPFDCFDYEEFYCNSWAFSSASLRTEDSKHGNWIPPVKFLNKDSRVTLARSVQNKAFEENVESKTTKETLEGKHIASSRNKMFDWGERTHLYDVTKFRDGDLFWGVVNLGVFEHIKLWINDYGNICASADGTITQPGSNEGTFISITNAELLRKILGLSQVQWATLCETVKEASCVLQFDACKEFELTGKTSLEKLWFFICKRRHVLPDQCMLVKMSGAVKCMKQFSVTPKVVVQEIRSISG